MIWVISHYFPYFSEACIILSPCHSRSTGHTQILWSRCIERRLPESSNNYMWLRSTFLSYPTTFLPCHSRSSGLTQILSSGRIVCRLPEWTNSYVWLRSSFLSYPTTFLTCKRPISFCLLATVEVVDRPKSCLVDVFCVDYSSNLTVTGGYEVLFSLLPLLSILVRELYHLFSMPQ
jgi:hypothetical protein